MRRVVRAGAGDHARAAANCFHGRAEEVELLVVAQRRRLSRRPADDDPVGAVVHKERREFAEALEVDGAVRPEWRHGSGDDGAEHRG